MSKGIAYSRRLRNGYDNCRLLLVLLLFALIFGTGVQTETGGLLYGTDSLARTALHPSNDDLLNPIHASARAIFRAENIEEADHLRLRETRTFPISLLLYPEWCVRLILQGMVLRDTSENQNSPHDRVLDYIHQMDGKGPETPSLL